MQIHEHEQLVLTEQKLQEQLHVDQAIEDIVRIIKQDSRASLLIVQLLRKYQLERTSCLQSTTTDDKNQTASNVNNFNQSNDVVQEEKFCNKFDCQQKNLVTKFGPHSSSCCLQPLLSSTQSQVQQLNIESNFKPYQYISSNINKPEEVLHQSCNNSQLNYASKQEPNNKETIVVTLDDGPDDTPFNPSVTLSSNMQQKWSKDDCSPPVVNASNQSSRSNDASTPIRAILAAAVAAEQAAAAAGKNNSKITKSKKKVTTSRFF